MRQAVSLLSGLVILAALVAAGGATSLSPAGAVPNDSDGDKVTDSLDGCVSLAEDADGVDSADGCPDTDVSVAVTKDEAYTLPIETVETRTVNISIINGNYAADVLAHVLAVSTIGACEVDLVPAPGDGVFPHNIDEDGDTVEDTHYYLLEWTVSLAAGASFNTTRDYNVSCHNPGQGSFELQVDAVPWPPVQEEDVEDLPNVHKNFPVLTVETPDTDGDGFADFAEGEIGTAASQACATTASAGDETPDAYPPDFDDSQTVNLSDLAQVLPPYFGSNEGGSGYSERRDLAPDGKVNLLDLFKVLPPYYGTNCGE